MHWNETKNWSVTHDGTLTYEILILYLQAWKNSLENYTPTPAWNQNPDLQYTYQAFYQLGNQGGI